MNDIEKFLTKMNEDPDAEAMKAFLLKQGLSEEDIIALQESSELSDEELGKVAGGHRGIRPQTPVNTAVGAYRTPDCGLRPNN